MNTKHLLSQLIITPQRAKDSTYVSENIPYENLHSTSQDTQSLMSESEESLDVKANLNTHSRADLRLDSGLNSHSHFIESPTSLAFKEWQSQGKDSCTSQPQGILPIALTSKKTLLIGAGAVARQKYEVLRESGFEVSIIAREIRDSFFLPMEKEIRQMSLDIMPDYHADSLEDGYLRTSDSVSKDSPGVNQFAFLSDFELVIDASGDKSLGEFLYTNRRKLGYLLNVVDMPSLCDFYFGAIARRGNVTVMVSSNGASPILAQSIRNKIVNLLPKLLGNFAHFLQQTRTKPLSQAQRKSIQNACKENLGKVFIIGCGPGDFQSLSLRALEVFSLLDVALIDNLVSKEIWEFLENLGVECISVGKQKGKQSFKQEEINVLMLKFAKEGKCVGRLKGGDPVIFGRVWEEGSFLKKEGVEVSCISGISSSLCGALTSGIVPTLRGVSSGVLIVSAHLRESVFHTEWLHWLKDSPYTLIVMMAYSFAERIVEDARGLGIDLNTDAAFVSKVDSKDQKSVIGTLAQLPQMAELCEKPAILIIGKAVQNALEMPYMGERIILSTRESTAIEVEQIPSKYNKRSKNEYKEVALV